MRRFLIIYLSSSYIDMTICIIYRNAARETGRAKRKNVVSAGDQILVVDHYHCLKKDRSFLDNKAEKYVFFSRLGCRRLTMKGKEGRERERVCLMWL